MLLKLKKVWIWFQNYWFVPVLAASSLLMYYLFRKKTGAVQDVLQTKKESYEKQIQILNDSHEKELQKKGTIAILHLNPCKDSEKANHIKNENNCTDILWVN